MKGGLESDSTLKLHRSMLEEKIAHLLENDPSVKYKGESAKNQAKLMVRTVEDCDLTGSLVPIQARLSDDRHPYLFGERAWQQFYDSSAMRAVHDFGIYHKEFVWSHPPNKVLDVATIGVQYKIDLLNSFFANIEGAYSTRNTAATIDPRYISSCSLFRFTNLDTSFSLH